MACYGDDQMPAPHTSYLICSTPRTGSSLLCDALTATGVAGRPEEYFQFRARTGFPRRPQEYFEGADDPEIFDILGPRTRVEEDEARYDPSRFERYDGYLHVGARGRHDAERRVRRQGHVGLLQRLRHRPALGRAGPPAARGVRARAVGLPEPALPVGDPARQGATGRLAVAGAAVVELVERPGHRPGRGRPPALQRGRHRSPDPRHPGPRGRVAGATSASAASSPTRSCTRSSCGTTRARSARSCATSARPAPRRRPSPSPGGGRSPTGSRAAGPSATGPSRARLASA